MRVGVVFPQTEIGTDRGAIRAYADGVQELGYQHILAYDHVLGADTTVHTGWQGPYDLETTFHEPMVLFGYLAAFTIVELVTGIIILPQRQTALVAKQAAEVDLLSGGRLRLGVAIGWNHVEYASLGEDFSTRGARLEEQVSLLRRLWTEESVTFEGRFDRIEGAGICPLPLQRPIPLWFGASSPQALRRAGRLSDGFFPQVPPGERLDEALAHVAEGARDAGRDPSEIGMEGRMGVGHRDVAKIERHLTGWREAGASHVSFNTMGFGLHGVDGHLAALAAAADVALD
ncbi:MAG TPA: LLM class F420-dependent oxidoreductase [Acidimicrobiales bacterium]|nr:LLM class F420-dependent oxidoreductase [Acidimicrobiales bacterium]